MMGLHFKWSEGLALFLTREENWNFEGFLLGQGCGMVD
jgi:hypothetical protein